MKLTEKSSGYSNMSSSISFIGGRIDSSKAEEIVQQITATAGNITIHFNNVEFVENSKEIIFDNLKHNNNISSLSLNNLQLTDEDIGNIVAIVKNNGKIQQLDLSDNRITDEGAIALANALSQNRSLQSLKLIRNRVGSAGASAIFKMLGERSNLKELNLSDNPAIGVQAITDAANALNTNRNVTSLILNNCGMNGSLIPLSKVLRKYSALKILDLGANGATDIEGLAASLAIPSSASRVEVLNISENITHPDTLIQSVSFMKNLFSIKTLLSLNIADLGFHKDSLDGVQQEMQESRLIDFTVGPVGHNISSIVTNFIDSLAEGFRNNTYLTKFAITTPNIDVPGTLAQRVQENYDTYLGTIRSLHNNFSSAQSIKNTILTDLLNRLKLPNILPAELENRRIAIANGVTNSMELVMKQISNQTPFTLYADITRTIIGKHLGFSSLMPRAYAHTFSPTFPHAGSSSSSSSSSLSYPTPPVQKAGGQQTYISATDTPTRPTARAVPQAMDVDSPIANDHILSLIPAERESTPAAHRRFNTSFASSSSTTSSFNPLAPEWDYDSSSEQSRQETSSEAEHTPTRRQDRSPVSGANSSSSSSTSFNRASNSPEQALSLPHLSKSEQVHSRSLVASPSTTSMTRNPFSPFSSEVHTSSSAPSTGMKKLNFYQLSPAQQQIPTKRDDHSPASSTNSSSSSSTSFNYVPNSPEQALSIAHSPTKNWREQVHGDTRKTATSTRSTSITTRGSFSPFTSEITTGKKLNFDQFSPEQERETESSKAERSVTPWVIRTRPGSFMELLNTHASSSDPETESASTSMNDDNSASTFASKPCSKKGEKRPFSSGDSSSSENTQESGIVSVVRLVTKKPKAESQGKGRN